VTGTELRAIVMGRLKTGRAGLDLERVGEEMDKILAPVANRDRKVQEQGGGVRPYFYDAQSVLWLERAVRRNMGI
jgi:hypothetical protein